MAFFVLSPVQNPVDSLIAYSFSFWATNCLVWVLLDSKAIGELMTACRTAFWRVLVLIFSTFVLVIMNRVPFSLLHNPSFSSQSRMLSVVFTCVLLFNSAVFTSTISCVNLGKPTPQFSYHQNYYTNVLLMLYC